MSKLIEKIVVRNFKNFKKVDINLRDFNVLIGANAAGKTNFVNIFKFIRDMSIHGLQYAFEMQGGSEFVKNLDTEINEPFYMKIIFIPDEDTTYLKKAGSRNIDVITEKAEYGLTINFTKNGNSYRIEEDKILLNLRFKEKKQNFDRKTYFEDLGKGAYEITKKGLSITSRFLNLPPEVKLVPEEFLPKFVNDFIKSEHGKELMLIQVPFTMFLFPIVSILNGIRIFDFDPKLPKKSVPFSGIKDLDEDGQNLALTLNHIFSKKKGKESFLRFLKDLLPFAKDLKEEKNADKTLFFKLQESFFAKKYIPSTLMSDGTINIISLLTALYFQNNKFMVFEEPERNVHPKLISRIVKYMQDATQKKQIVISTHNPAFLRNIAIEDVILIKRNNQGVSEVSRPINREDINEFLKNEIGIDELLYQDIL